MEPVNTAKRWARKSALVALLGLTACASTGQAPVGAMESARQAIANAEHVRASENAALELTLAREKLSAAEQAVDNEDMELAQQMADEATVLAELAVAKSEMADARQINEEVVRTTQAITEEIQRNQESRNDYIR